MNHSFVPFPNEGRRSLLLLSQMELDDLRELNTRLREVQVWIDQRAPQAVAGYFMRGGVDAKFVEPMIFEDVEVEATIDCILRDTHQLYRHDDDNIVATLRYNTPRNSRTDERNWDDTYALSCRPLSDIHFCWLFHDLCFHELDGDYDKALSVGGVWIEFKIIEQREVYWK